MCGICGILDLNDRPVSVEKITAMREALVHRGPDDAGLCQATGLALGFRRLSIIDVSDGHQPMRRGESTIVFNGEIYNYRELRAECERGGARFETQSDTEVLLELFRREGEACLKKLNGMFAFAVWNEEKKELFLARDRIGIK